MTIIHKYDANANDSDKSFVVPQGRMWRIDWIHISYTASATVGTRVVAAEIYDETNVLRADFTSGADLTATNTGHYLYTQGVPKGIAFINGEVTSPLPHNLVLLTGWYIRIRDSAAIAATTDDMTVSLQITEWATN